MGLRATECKVCGAIRDDRFIGRRCHDCHLAYARDDYHKNSVKRNASTMSWRERHPDQYREYQRIIHKERYSNPDIREKSRYKNRFGPILRNWVAQYKLGIVFQDLRPATVASMEALIGCKMEVLIERMEREWIKDFGVEIDWNMLFIQAGPDKLEIEHKTKIHTFDFTKEEDIRTAWHFSNLKILPRKINCTGRPIMVA